MVTMLIDHGFSEWFLKRLQTLKQETHCVLKSRNKQMILFDLFILKIKIRDKSYTRKIEYFSVNFRQND